MAEVRIKPGSLEIEILDEGKVITINCPWMGPLDRVVIEPKGKPEKELWRATAGVR